MDSPAARLLLPPAPVTARQGTWPGGHAQRRSMIRERNCCTIITPARSIAFSIPGEKPPEVAGEMDKRADDRRYGNSEEAEYQRKGVGVDGGSRKVEKIPTEKCKNWRG